MTKIFTQNDLMRYLYGETSREESQIIHALILTDSELYETYNQLLETKKEVDYISQNPSKNVIDKILQYAEIANLHSV